MLQGIVIKAYSGFYYVKIDNDLWECRLRGKFKLKKQDVLAGDKVKIKETGTKTGVIEEILPRSTKLDRPPIANVDQVVIVTACAKPSPQTELLDRMLIQAEAKGIFPVLCFNKMDLLDKDTGDELAKDYREAGYPIVFTDALTGTGIDTLKKYLEGHISVFAGPSGVGKSTLLNAVYPGFKLKTGKVSDKIGRGRHTTRHVELLEIFPGTKTFVADTPGFSNLYLPAIPKEHLAEMFPEFLPYLDNCKFAGCLHRAEPACAVKGAVESGKISKKRYSHYLIFVEELIEAERRY